MKRLTICSTVLAVVLCLPALADGPPAIELLLPGGTLYSMADRAYRSLSLPDGWTVAAGAYSPDFQSLALLLVGSDIVPKMKPAPAPSKTKPKAKGSLPRVKSKPVPVAPSGPVNAAVRPWLDSTRLIILNRSTGAVSRSWRLPPGSAARVWTVSWTSASVVSAMALDPGAPAEKAQITYGFDTVRNLALKPQIGAASASPTGDAGACPRTLATTHFQDNTERFTLEAASCSKPPETSDFYRIVRANERTHKDDIYWEYRVTADKTACSKEYACYTGSDVQFLSTPDQLFLAWDADLYAVNETDDGRLHVELVTQLLPQYSHPWAIASGDTHLNTLDVAIKVAFQQVTSTLSLPRGDNPVLYTQNFCPTRSFHADVQVGPYTKNLMVPAGYQVGPVDIGSFKDRSYTPVLISVTWTVFHHIVDPVLCALPYTVAPNTKGIVVSLTEGDQGMLHCHIEAQEDH